MTTSTSQNSFIRELARDLRKIAAKIARTNTSDKKDAVAEEIAQLFAWYVEPSDEYITHWEEEIFGEPVLEIEDANSDGYSSSFEIFYEDVERASKFLTRRRANRLFEFIDEWKIDIMKYAARIVQDKKEKMLLDYAKENGWGDVPSEIPIELYHTYSYVIVEVDNVWADNVSVPEGWEFVEEWSYGGLCASDFGYVYGYTIKSPSGDLYDIYNAYAFGEGCWVRRWHAKLKGE